MADEDTVLDYNSVSDEEFLHMELPVIEATDDDGVADIVDDPAPDDLDDGELPPPDTLDDEPIVADLEGELGDDPAIAPAPVVDEVVKTPEELALEAAAAAETSVDSDDISTKLFAPFKANGKEMAVDNVEDAITLMQRGANYNKKMQNMKPHLKNIQMLEENGITSVDDLNFLIELHNKKPEAIAKLLQDGKIDPLDIGNVETEGYKPKSHEVSDASFELKEAMVQLRESPHYSEVLGIVTEGGWDADSTEFLLGNPTQLQLLNDQMEAGIFQKITGAVETERMFGRLEGKSDVQAYFDVGTALQAKGAFGTPAQASVVPEANQLASESADQTAAKAKVDAKRNAATSPKNSGSGKSVTSVKIDPAMSDDEFLAAMDKNFG